MKREISTIVFDFGDVLNWHMKLEEEKALLVQRSGLDRDAFFSRYWAHRAEYDRGTLHAAEYWNQVLAPRDGSLDDQRMQQLIEADIRASLRLNPVMWSWVRTLKACGYTLAVLSNLPFDLMSYHRENSFGDLFDRQFFSCEIKRLKPEAEIYVHVEQELGADGGELLFLDDKQENVVATRACGWLVIVFEDSHQLSRVIDDHFQIPRINIEGQG